MLKQSDIANTTAVIAIHIRSAPYDVTHKKQLTANWFPNWSVDVMRTCVLCGQASMRRRYRHERHRSRLWTKFLSERPSNRSVIQKFGGWEFSDLWEF